MCNTALSLTSVDTDAWIKTMRKKFLLVNKVPKFRTIEDVLMYINRNIQYVSELKNELYYNKGFWADYRLKPDGSATTKLQLKIRSEIKEAESILKSMSMLYEKYASYSLPDNKLPFIEQIEKYRFIESADNFGVTLEKHQLSVLESVIGSLGVDLRKSISSRLFRALSTLLAKRFIFEKLDTEFSIGRVNVILENEEYMGGEYQRDPNSVRQYVRYFDAARQLLERKKLGKLWYGQVFLKCVDCGGTNKHGADLGVGAKYSIHKDTVTIFSDPSRHIPEMLIHELGHRMWFKFLNRERRLFFGRDFGDVPAVSDYGSKSEIEDFAEVFTWYVLDRKFNNDQKEYSRQLERFRYVLTGDRIGSLSLNMFTVK